MYYIAEIGLSHLGSIKRASNFIYQAKKCGADAVKFQHHTLDEMSSTHPWRETIERCLLSTTDLSYLSQCAHDNGLAFICTPFSVKAATDLLTTPGIDLDYLKVGSGEVSHTVMLREIARLIGLNKPVPIIMSTGMCFKDNNKPEEFLLRAVDILKPHALLYCVSAYPYSPSPAEIEAGMCRVGAVLDETGLSAQPGYSMHTRDLSSAVKATLYGAQVIEAHFNPNRDLVGEQLRTPDYEVEIGHDEFIDLIGFCWLASRARSDHKGRTSYARSPQNKHKSEHETLKMSRHTAYATEDIVCGDVLTLDNIGFRREGHGSWSVHDKHLLGSYEFDEYVSQGLAVISSFRVGKGDSIPGFFVAHA